MELKGNGLRVCLARGQIKQSSMEQKDILLVERESARKLLLDK